MPRKSATKSATDVATVEKSTVATTVVAAEKNVKTIKEPLNDSDEIEVISIIPNVSYKDNRTGDFYEWEEIGHIEIMTFETLKNMWRNSKGYFKNMWLKPLDERVINKFGLTSTFKKYEYLMDESNYARENIEDICENISNTPNELKISICNKIKSMIENGNLSDIFVIKTLGRHLNLDLTSILN